MMMERIKMLKRRCSNGLHSIRSKCVLQRFRWWFKLWSHALSDANMMCDLIFHKLEVRRYRWINIEITILKLAKGRAILKCTLQMWFCLDFDSRSYDAIIPSIWLKYSIYFRGWTEFRHSEFKFYKTALCFRKFSIARVHWKRFCFKFETLPSMRSIETLQLWTLFNEQYFIYYDIKFPFRNNQLQHSYYTLRVRCAYSTIFPWT